MTITLELPPETEARLLEQAKARGVSLDALVKAIITNQAAAESAKPLEGVSLQAEQLDRAIDDMFDTVQVPPGVGQGVMHRENWYR